MSCRSVLIYWKRNSINWGLELPLKTLVQTFYSIVIPWWGHRLAKAWIKVFKKKPESTLEFVLQHFIVSELNDRHVCRNPCNIWLNFQKYAMCVTFQWPPSLFHAKYHCDVVQKWCFSLLICCSLACASLTNQFVRNTLNSNVGWNVWAQSSVGNHLLKCEVEGRG